jgi:hypothetical protein
MATGKRERATEKDQKTYSWSFSGGKINCCASKTSTCTVSKLWEVAAPTAFHDTELQQATEEINQILEGIKRRDKDQTRELSLIQIKDRHFLVWATPGIVGPDDDDSTIRRMLRLKRD